MLIAECTKCGYRQTADTAEELIAKVEDDGGALELDETNYEVDYAECPDCDSCDLEILEKEDI